MVEPVIHAVTQTQGEILMGAYVTTTSRVYEQLTRWVRDGKLPDMDIQGAIPNALDELIFNIFGYPDVEMLMLNWSDKEIDLSNKLCGPYGWTIYKVHMCKMDNKHE